MNEQDSLSLQIVELHHLFLRASAVAVHITGVDHAYIVMQIRVLRHA